MQKRNKGFVGIEILLAILLIFGIGFLFFFNRIFPKSIDILPGTSITEIPQDWLIYSKEGAFTIKHPSDFRVYETNGYPEFYFSKKDEAGNSAHFFIKKVIDPYNRPIEKSFSESEKEGTRVEDITVNGFRGRHAISWNNEDIEAYAIDVNGTYYSIYFYNYGNSDENRILFQKIMSTVQFDNNEKVKPEVYVYDGDIYYESNKLTNWGYNFDPVISPDKKWIAYVSDSEETVEASNKPRTGLIAFSKNIWIMDRYGKNAKPLTRHLSNVDRGNLYWIDNTKLFFSDGEVSAKVYNVLDQSLRTLFGPEFPLGSCNDSCYMLDENYQAFSQSKKYFMVVTSSPTDSIGKLGVANLQTLQVFEKDLPYAGCIQDIAIDESLNTLSYKGANTNQEDESCEEFRTVKINLQSEALSVQ